MAFYTVPIWLPRYVTHVFFLSVFSLSLYGSNHSKLHISLKVFTEVVFEVLLMQPDLFIFPFSLISFFASTHCQLWLWLYTISTFLLIYTVSVFLRLHTVSTFLSLHTVSTFLSVHTVSPFLSRHTVSTFLSFHTVSTFLSFYTVSTFLSFHTVSDFLRFHTVYLS